MGVGKVLGFGAIALLVGSVAAMQNLGDELQTTFTEQAVAADGEGADPVLAVSAHSEPSSGPSPSAEVATTAPENVGSTILEQAIFDAFPSSPPKSRSEKKKAAQAADFVGYAINSQGHLCARPIEAQKAAAEMYGVGCITRRDGYGRSNYLVNTRTGQVTEI